MSTEMKYQERLKRVSDAVALTEPEMIPFIPIVQCFPYLQAGYTMDNPFQRRLSLTTLYAVTAAGVSKTATKLIDIPVEKGKAYLDWLKPRRAKSTD